MSHDQILDLGQRWADAEQRADVAALDTLLADDFRAVGPRGAVGIQTQQATWQGQDASGRFRVSQVAVQEGGRWRLAGLHISGPIPDVPPR